MNERTIDPLVAGFIEKLARLDAADRARLKRNAGRSLEEARGANLLIFSLLPYGLNHAQEEMYFLVATLFPCAEGGGNGNLGEALRRAQKTGSGKGIDRRIEALLDADSVQLPFRLRQTIHFLQSKRVKVNWAGLLADLLQWNHPDRFVQQRWARSYYATETQSQPA